MPLASRLIDWPGVRANEPLARHVQFGIGGPADCYLEIAGWEPLRELLPLCAATDTAVTVIGAGSNALILDGGIAGLVIKMTGRRLRVIDPRTVELSGGSMLPRAALDCAQLGMAGMEFGIGIPGTAGASVWGNAGAFGSEIKDVLIDCDVIGPDGDVRTYSAGECGFAYRRSRFRDALPRPIVVAARFQVRPDDPVDIRARTDAVQADRKAAQPYGIRSLGSVFKNPPGDRAGRLVEAAGLKGRRAGGAEIATKHANFIVNRDHARATDVVALVDLAHDAVLERFGVELEREIIYLGRRVAD